ncbi:AAA family ATPase [Rheinheimera sp. EpRS3]|uniref:AAA family ATPase n=1 Tax=Rheinheimera sp. EpRS3 TaxID=1712383 RepID=UPI00074846D5|nr:ATP/GTP-binding protein [Rheinheimera sp. EpRS3]KUM54429.1 hypothetical protein AR688_14015 [Rheinheimera sp. EpRS3]
MLIRFTVSNFNSFLDEVELSMIPSKERAHPSQVYKTKQTNLVNILRGAIIYGANASGKSNLVKAIEFARNLILRGKGPNKKFDLPLFKLCKQETNPSSRFEFEILVQGNIYAYGFELKNSYVESEWLFRLTKDKETLIFSRAHGTSNHDEFTFGKTLQEKSTDEQSFLQFTSRGTRQNQLFLTESIERNIEDFSDVFNWFDRTLKVISPSTMHSGIEFKISQDSTFKDYLQKVLHLADTGIDAIRTEQLDSIKSAGLPPQILDRLKEDLDNDEAALATDPDAGRRLVIKKQDGELVAFKLSTTHKCQTQDLNVSFDLEEESDGTRRLIELTPSLYEMAYSKEPSVYIIDEIDRSLHPHITRLLVREHLESEKNTQSQLIVTTHETSLLDVSLVRRDEIWFVQKSESGISSLYSLNNFQPRYDKDIRKDYLLGRYGAIPFVGDFKRLNR